MEWTNMNENLNRKGSGLRKSVSTIGFNMSSSNLNLREARSFTGALEELKSSIKSSSLCQHEHTCHDHMYKDHEDRLFVESGYITKEVSSNQVFLVKDEMLTYRGKKYSLNDIATRWKKDCRMWLWKNKMNKKKTKSVVELREKIQNLKIPNRSPM